MLDRTEYENYWYAFQQKLDKILDERNMTYRGLSIELGKSPGYIHDVLSRRIDPSTISLFEMAAYFDCTIWDFLNITKKKFRCIVCQTTHRANLLTVKKTNAKLTILHS